MLTVPSLSRGGTLWIRYTEGNKTCRAVVQTREQGHVFDVAESEVYREKYFPIAKADL